MEHSNHQKWENTGIVCPLCKHPDVHFLKETGVWVCNHCQYTWHTIEGCGLR
jgi:ribosomal protein L37AE/L43A